MDPSCRSLGMLDYRIFVVLLQVLDTIFHYSKVLDYCTYEFSSEFHLHKILNNSHMVTMVTSCHPLHKALYHMVSIPLLLLHRIGLHSTEVDYHTLEYAFVFLRHRMFSNMHHKVRIAPNCH